jgi:hypothetical protein
VVKGLQMPTLPFALFADQATKSEVILKDPKF